MSLAKLSISSNSKDFNLSRLLSESVNNDTLMELVGAKIRQRWGQHPLNKKTKRTGNRSRPVPKFGDWDEHDPASAQGFSAIFDEIRKEKMYGPAAAGGAASKKKFSRERHRLGRFIKAIKKGWFIQKKWFACWWPKLVPAG